MSPPSKSRHPAPAGSRTGRSASMALTLHERRTRRTYTGRNCAERNCAGNVLSRAVRVMPARMCCTPRYPIPPHVLSGAFNGQPYPSNHREATWRLQSHTIGTVENTGHTLFMVSPDATRLMSACRASEPVTDETITTHSIPALPRRRRTPTPRMSERSLDTGVTLC